MKRPETFFPYPCIRCGEIASVKEYVRGFTEDHVPGFAFRGLLVQGLFSMRCECGCESKLRYDAILDCDNISDEMVTAFHNLKREEAKQEWDRIRRGEPRPEPEEPYAESLADLEHFKEE